MLNEQELVFCRFSAFYNWFPNSKSFTSHYFNMMSGNPELVISFKKYIK